ncbi:MAG TPA: hypothetical protein VHH90_03105 [Polyangia bacterium]|nr:hypothetical protein [Polyangia bacterium]
MKFRAVLLLSALAGCGGSSASRAIADASSRSRIDSGVDGPALFALPASCASDTAVPPETLVCTGLYADIDSKMVAPGVEPYAPAVPLWSDGAQKQRWISLPAGGTIDNSNPADWVFPVGTKVWKEFSRQGHRIETRLWYKVKARYWVDATYVWNGDESAATRSAGGDIPLGDGGTYHVPTEAECEKCHNGSQDNILGFSQALLGLAGASGLTLDVLTAQGWLTNPPESTQLTIGDDGTGAAAPALGWLHVNCGIACHNGNPNADAYAAGMLLRLNPTQLDGRPVDAFDALKTTIGIAANNPNWSGRIRIVPGSTDNSLLYQLISHRGVGMQMPPIATSLVDTNDDTLVAAWIRQMPHLASRDAATDAPSDGIHGAPDAGADTGRPTADAGSNPDAAIDAAIDAVSTRVDADSGLAVDGGHSDGPPVDGGGARDAGSTDATSTDATTADAATSEHPVTDGGARDGGLTDSASDAMVSDGSLGN